VNKVLATLSIGTLMALTAAPGIANASGGGGDVRATGRCSLSSTSKIKLSPDNGRIETEFEVDQNRNGVTWNVSISDNGVLVAKGQATTTAPSGSFEFRRLIPNRAGTDKVTARAKNPATGETCSATASL
jgi:hypothetical protein